MKTFYATRNEVEELGNTVAGLRELSNKVVQVRCDLVSAGVGTFATEAEFAFLRKLETKIDKITNKLAKRYGQANKYAPAKTTLPVA